MSQAQVVLLHGLARSANSLIPMELALKKAKYLVLNQSYPSTEHCIDSLTTEHVWPKIAARFDTAKPIHFITHSMGGIIVRNLAAKIPDLTIGRVVMLAPPNHGSEIVDKLGNWWLFQQLNGPAGSELSTDASSVPNQLNQLGQVDFETGVIAGDKSVNSLFAKLFKGKNDGKVSVKSTQVEGMTDFLCVDASHTFIMMRPAVIKQCLHFLQKGRFVHQS
ncbi:alpha/beta hydrolase [Catenovulum sp. SM1970]|uniref:esterase/lipase family protein n=1 Tax=Marinifaba aquimaris TaxID=2741323 RepID=UPI0015730C41|nr:alpha/beta hydrolase [Marinifaba aquimaris]NTS77775.1 alpha/beta hydrolase [Marinifaba aquimaris]